MNDQFTFFRSFGEAFWDFDDKDRLALYDGLTHYALEGVEPEFSGMLATVWKLVKPNVDKSLKRSKTNTDNANSRVKKATAETNRNDGKAVAEPIAKPIAKATGGAIVSKDKDLDKDLDKDWEEDKDLDSAGAQFASAALAVFNEETGKDVRELPGTTFADLERIRHNGRTLDDIRTVVRRKRRQWGNDPRSASWVCPSTLFGPKFEQYLNEQEVKDDADDYAGLW